ncbi:MAG: hypothetical protein OXQ29_22720 [Rhodospirillaceae bacterium]|nr:hypothetical protein [Rhodospirillaceae bacterium]
MSDTEALEAEPYDTVNLEAHDYHCLYYLNEHSLHHVDYEQPHPTVPYVAIASDDHCLGICIEPVNPDPPYFLSSRIQGFHQSLLDKLEYMMPDSFPAQEPPDSERGISTHVMQGLLNAIESHNIHLIPLQPDSSEHVFVTCEFRGWSHNHFDIKRMYAGGIDRDASPDLLAVQMRTDSQGPFLDTEEFRHGLLWIASNLGMFHHPEWTPWDGDRRWLTLTWFQPKPGTWARGIELKDELPE